MDDLHLIIHHDPEKGRFEIRIDGVTAVTEYIDKNHVMVFTHTEVPPELEGRGLASRLARAALEYAKWTNKKVMALCPYHCQLRPKKSPISAFT